MRKPEKEASAEAPDERPVEGSGEGPIEPGGDADASGEDAVVRERDEYLAQWQRARADYQNLRRRMQQDIDAAVRRAKEGLLADQLVVLDNLEMALGAPCSTDEGKNLLVGVQMVRDQLLHLLEREDVRPIETIGAFDPSLHQAVARVASAEHAPGEIVRTVRRGYRLGDTVLRHAHVEVAGEPPAADGDAPEGPASEPRHGA